MLSDYIIIRVCFRFIWVNWPFLETRNVGGESLNLSLPSAAANMRRRMFI